MLGRCEDGKRRQTEKKNKEKKKSRYAFASHLGGKDPGYKTTALLHAWYA